ncbi:MAG TPA: YbhB/YbcL family Raf kinase inhibitor-like protein [Candidatus Sulfotelmatobacter sp.]|nr:YbhB/YbcL family Raf kinase inhibitor-like protein [Candidatus Sulfotelmatobacter sp.]
MTLRFAALTLAAALVTGTAASAMTLRPARPPAGNATLTVTSADFTNGAPLPLWTGFKACGGQNVSPALHWTKGPAKTKSYVVTIFDPDAPTGVGFWHWTLFDVPASVTSLPKNYGAHVMPPATAGYTDYGLSGYQGPCPPNGDPPHHYHITVSALDVATIPGGGPGTTGAVLSFGTPEHVIARGEIVGTYKR